MDGFGEMLRRERENRETPLAEVARRTQIGIRYLEALEREDFDGLPGPRGFGKLYIRAYAELLGFDPEPLLTAFERQQLERERQATVPDSSTSSEPRRRRIRYVPPPRKGTSVSTGETPPAETSPVAPSADRSIEEPPPVDDRPAPAMAPPASPPTEPEVPTPSTVMQTEPSSESSPETIPHSTAATAGEGRPPRRVAVGVVGAAAVVVTIVVVAFVARGPEDAPPTGPAASPGPSVATQPEPAREGSPAVPSNTDEVSDAVGARPADPAANPAPPTAPAVPPASISSAPAAENQRDLAATGPLSVTYHELGGAVANLRVEDVRREFVEGSIASFLTRVVGGAPGRRVRHVWLRQGRIVQDLALELGGPDWRTYSTKTLWGAGDWAVEARDGEGSVLARIEFRCEPAAR